MQQQQSLLGDGVKRRKAVGKINFQEAKDIGKSILHLEGWEDNKLIKRKAQSLQHLYIVLYVCLHLILHFNQTYFLHICKPNLKIKWWSCLVIQVD